MPGRRITATFVYIAPACYYSYYIYCLTPSYIILLGLKVVTILGAVTVRQGLSAKYVKK